MLVAYDSALERILAAAEPLVPVDTPLERCSGRVLAHGLHAPLDLPPFDNSAMDGYAVRAANTASAAPERPAFLQIIGEIAAGSAPGDVHLESGQAARIFTGGIVPPGADAIIPVEDTEPEGAPPGQVAVTLPAEPNAYIRHAGGDMRKGDLALLAGTALRAYEIAQAASLGAASLPVHPAPRVVLIATGNELVEPGLAEPLQTGQIYNSNVYALEALVRESGGETLARLHAVDTPDSIRDTLRQAARLQPDIIISSGGVSVGDYDYRESRRRGRGQARRDRLLAGRHSARQAVRLRALRRRALLRPARQPRLHHRHLRAVRPPRPAPPGGLTRRHQCARPHACPACSTAAAQARAGPAQLPTGRQATA